MSKRQKIDACCCSWGDTCNVIRNAILARPSVEGYDLWKEPHAQINSSGSAKHNMFVQMLKQHLGLKDMDDPERFRIAPHHFQLKLWQFRQDHKTMQWVKPLSRKEAKDFGNSVHCIDQHPSSTTEKPMYFQTPNVPKSELLCLLATWSTERGERQ